MPTTAQAPWRAPRCWPRTSTRGPSSRPRTTRCGTAECRDRRPRPRAWRRRRTPCPRSPTSSVAGG
eukprot:6505483-Lingulodinium_polyedra.AAC.1